MSKKPAAKPAQPKPRDTRRQAWVTFPSDISNPFHPSRLFTVQGLDGTGILAILFVSRDFREVEKFARREELKLHWRPCATYERRCVRETERQIQRRAERAAIHYTIIDDGFARYQVIEQPSGANIYQSHDHAEARGVAIYLNLVNSGRDVGIPRPVPLAFS